MYIRTSLSREEDVFEAFCKFAKKATTAAAKLTLSQATDGKVEEYNRGFPVVELVPAVPALKAFEKPVNPILSLAL